MYVYLLRTQSIQTLQDEIAGQDGVRKWTFLQTLWEKIFRKLSTIRICEVKYLWGIVKQIQHVLFREVVKFTGVGRVRLLPSASRREVVSHIQHLGTSNFYYFPQYHAVFVYYHTCIYFLLQGVQECSIPCFRKILKISNQQWALL